jgi:hypothetical protein
MDDESAIYHDEQPDAHVGPAPRRSWWKRVLKGLAITVVALVVLGLLLYNFGGMMPPSAEAKAQYAQLKAAGAVPSAQNKLHIPIPGCVCHSSNPILQIQHANRSMNQCAGCHSGTGIVAQR